MSRHTDRWTTAGGVTVTRTRSPVDPHTARDALAGDLDQRRGMLLSCGVHQPGRYRPRDVGYVDPPLEIVARGRLLAARALNARGRVLLPAVAAAWSGRLLDVQTTGDRVRGTVPAADRLFSEDERTRQPGVLAALRGLVEVFAGPVDDVLGLWGAFGYDLVLEFDPVPLGQPRCPEDRTLVLHLPDSVVELDEQAGTAVRHDYDFVVDGRSTTGLPRPTAPAGFTAPREPATRRDHAVGEYADQVRAAKERFAAGDLFEVVLSQCQTRPATYRPSEMFGRLHRRNPAPYGVLANLGEEEFLVGASPEMFVRVGRQAAGTGRPVDTCPVSGTVSRGRDPLEDSRQIRRLLESAKEESELTMCTDVDRNDKARVCEPGTVRVIARRQIEVHSTLIHTVDHVRGVLRADRDALDAFQTHLWAVTVTGAPKRAAVEFIEWNERSPRRWYGGAVGRIGFDGTLDTAMTLRTVEIRGGVAIIRAGATLLYDSDPVAEEQETVLKAQALLAAVELPDVTFDLLPDVPDRPLPAAGVHVLLVDHDDSFVHMLADYLRQTGATVTTFRHGFPHSLFDRIRPDLVVLSPGPGRPADREVGRTMAAAELRGIPVFGVCLGLQGMAEFFGAELDVLPVPVHGKPSVVERVGDGGVLLAGLPSSFEVGRYHSLHVVEATLPPDLVVTARTTDGVVMAVEHRVRPMAAVQFHPESIMSLHDGLGLAIVANAVTRLVGRLPVDGVVVASVAPAPAAGSLQGGDRRCG